MTSGVLGKKTKFVMLFMEVGCRGSDVFVNIDSMCQQCLSRYHVDKLSMIKSTLLWSCGYKIILAGKYSH